MPVRIRLATKGASRNRSTSIHPPWKSLLRYLERFDQQRQIVIEQLEIVRDFSLASYRGRHDDYLRSCLSGDALRSLGVEVGLHEDQAYLFTFNHVDEFQCMARRGWNSGPWLNLTHRHQPKKLQKISPGAVIGNHLPPVIRFHFSQPFLVGLGKPLAERLEILVEVRAVRR